MTLPVVSYAVDDETVAQFEIEPSDEWEDVSSSDRILGRIREAVASAAQAAKEVLDTLKDAGPDDVEMKFGIKVSGGADWLIARAATEGNFDVTMTWQQGTSAE